MLDNFLVSEPTKHECCFSLTDRSSQTWNELSSNPKYIISADIIYLVSRGRWFEIFYLRRSLIKKSLVMMCCFYLLVVCGLVLLTNHRKVPRSRPSGGFGCWKSFDQPGSKNDLIDSWFLIPAEHTHSGCCTTAGVTMIIRALQWGNFPVHPLTSILPV